MKNISNSLPAAIFSIGFLCFSLTSSLHAQANTSSSTNAPWITNFQQALATAAAEKKDIALLFTASDWLDLAKTFDEKILSQKSFLKEATSHYTLVRLDFPKEIGKQDGQTTTQNQLLMRAYRVRGLPTLVLTDNLGRPYAITGYHDAGLTTWLEEFNHLRLTRERRDRLFIEASKASGVDRALLLAQALPDLPGNIAARFYRNVIDEIIELDPKNQSKRVDYYKSLIADVQYSDQMQKLTLAGDDEKMLQLSDQYLKTAKLDKAPRQSVLFNKVRIYKKRGEIEAAEKTLQQIITIDPDTTQGKQAALLLKENQAPSKNTN